MPMPGSPMMRALTKYDARAGSARAKADARVGIVAEGLVGRPTTAAEAGIGDARDDAARPGGDFEIAAKLKRPVHLWIDGQRPVANGQHLGLAGRWLARCREIDLVMRAVAEGLALGSAAAAERGAEMRWLAVKPDIGMHGIRPALANSDEIDRRHRLFRPAVLPAIANGAGRAGMGNAG